MMVSDLSATFAQLATFCLCANLTDVIVPAQS